MIKYGGEATEEVMEVVYNTIWEKERVPRVWKERASFPLYKKGNEMDLGNYSGITLLNVRLYGIMHSECEISYIPE